MMAATPGQSFSLMLSKCLDSLGYGYRNIKTSQFAAKMVENSMNESIKRSSGGDPAIVAYIAGSKKEGISFFTAESDLDVMMIWSSFHCSDYSHTENPFTMQLNDVPAGYTLLEGTQYTNIKRQRNDTIYLSHYDELFCNAFLKTRDIHGPSFTLTVPGFFSFINNGIPFTRRQRGPSVEHGQDLLQNKHYYTQDLVPVMICKCSYYLNKWCKRKRYHNYPPPGRIQEIVKLDAHIAPVGCKNTDFSDYQWRISYTMAEIALIQFFNSTQYKVYVVLRMLSKEVINNAFSEITSYVMKNVILWVSELYPLTMFQEDNIPHCLLICLQFLRRCVRERYLPNYMIPDRNLFFGIADNNFESLSLLLAYLISEGGMVIRHCGWIVPRIQLISRIGIPQKYVDTICSISLFMLITWLNKRPVTLKIIPNVEFALYSIERITSRLQGIEKVPMLAIVKIFKRITQSSLMYATSDLSDYKEVIEHILQLEKNITDSVEACVREMTKQFATQKLQSMFTGGDLQIIKLFIIAFTDSNVFKHFNRSNIEKVLERQVSATPVQQKEHQQQLIQSLTVVQDMLSSSFGELYGMLTNPMIS